MDKRLAAALGATARAARHRMGLTQADVAERVGVAAEVYGRLERGQMLPSVESLCRLATALEVSADELLGLSRGSPVRGSQLAEKTSRYGPPPPERRRLERRLARLDPSAIKLLGLVASALIKKR